MIICNTIKDSSVML